MRTKVETYNLLNALSSLTDIMVKEAEINEDNEHARLMLDNNPMACLLRDDLDTILDCNQAALDIFGVAGRDELSKDFYRFYPEYQPDGSRSVDKARTIFSNLLETGEVGDFEWTFRSASGEPLPMEVTVVRIQWDDRYFFLSYLMDLRKFKAIEQRMLENNKKEREKQLRKEAVESEHAEFWAKIEKIDCLDLSTGLERVDGKLDVYRKNLKLMLREIEKSDKNLIDFLLAEDMENFGIEMHGMKGTLDNIGAMELSSKALYLETASDSHNTGVCVLKLHDFLKELNELHVNLSDAFSVQNHNDDRTEIPSELPLIFENLIIAFDNTDLVLIDQHIERIDALKLSGKLKDEIEHVKDAVMIMDYAIATGHLKYLLNVMRHFE